MGSADSLLLPSVAHQAAQLPDADAARLMHADQHRSADWHTAVADLADDWRRDFQQAGQRGIVLQFHPLDENVQKIVGIVTIFVQ